MRDLTEIEKFYWLSNQSNPFTICVVVRFAKKQNLQTLESALSYLYNAYPILAVSIQSIDQPRFVFLDLPKTSVFFKRKVHNEEWEQEVDHEIHRPFNYATGPFARVTYLEGEGSHEILLAVDHIIADGISAIHILNKFFSYIEEIDNKIELHYNQELKLKLTCLETLVRDLPPLNEEMSPEWNIDHNSREPSSFDSIQAINTSINSGIAFCSLSTEQTSKFIGSCKRNGSTVHGGLSAAGLKCLFEMISKKSLDTLSKIDVRYNCPVNLRNYFLSPPCPTALGSIIGMLFLDMTVEADNSFWQLSRNINIHLKTELSDDLPSKTVRVLKSLSENCHSYEELQNARKCDKPLLGISNLGKVEINSDLFKIKEVYFFGALHGIFFNKDSFYICALTFRNRMFLSFIYPRPVISKHSAKKLVDNFMSHLATASDDF